jgi:two-component system, LuxR family, response regulator FixJ
MGVEISDSTLRPTAFIVDDDDAIRSGIADLVEAMGLGVETFGTAEEFLAAYNPMQPGCLILDLQMPGMSGLELQTALSIGGVHLPIIIITGHGNVNTAVRSMKLGVVDFLEKPFREQILLECVKKAIARDAQMRSQKSEHAACQQRLSRLTNRERQVMELLIQGKADKQIASELNISQRAASFHRLHIFRKTQVSSSAELTLLSTKMHPAK